MDKVHLGILSTIFFYIFLIWDTILTSVLTTIHLSNMNYHQAKTINRYEFEAYKVHADKNLEKYIYFIQTITSNKKFDKVFF